MSQWYQILGNKRLKISLLEDDDCQELEGDGDNYPNNGAKRTNSFQYLNSIPQDLRIHIFTFLDELDLGELSQASLSLNKDLRHPVLSQVRTAVINCNFRDKALDHSLLRLIKTTQKMQLTGKFSKFVNVKLNYPELIDHHWAEHGIERLIGPIRLTDVKSLDMSIEHDVAFKKRAWDDGFFTFGNEPVDCLPLTLGLLMPNLRHINLSNVCIPSDALNDLLRNCKNIESITWDYCKNIISITGFELYNCSLKHLQMDNAILKVCDDEIDEEVQQKVGGWLDVTSNIDSMHGLCIIAPTSKPGGYIFHEGLERVSFKNMRYQIEDSEKVVPLSQEALIKFVRAKKALKWFRSDLTPQNVSLLQAERPEITFVSK